MKINNKKTLHKRPSNKNMASKSKCGCSKTKKGSGKKTDSKRVNIERSVTLSDKAIRSKLNKPLKCKKVKTLGGKRTTTIYEKSSVPVTGGGDAFDIDSLGIVLGPDVSLGQIQISEDLFTARARINGTTGCGIIREYSCPRGTTNKRFCTQTGIRLQRCKWTRTGAISINANVTIPSTFSNLYNNNSNVRSCISEKIGVMRDYILNNIGPISQLDVNFLNNNLPRIQIEAITNYQSQVNSCLSAYMSSGDAFALSNGIRVRARVHFSSLSPWTRV
ncbi:hypothetical protein [Paenibacillus taichungensis]